MQEKWNKLGLFAYKTTLPLQKRIAPRIVAPRVRVVLKSPEGNILLVRTWFGKQRWSFPGGGIAKGESPETAALREVREETGLILRVDDLKLHDEIVYTDDFDMKFTIFEAEVAQEKLPKLEWFYRLEIIDRQWWNGKDKLEPLSHIVKWYLENKSGKI
jgi:8-oxo-dGTP pyrophosphatase MutT (NUDIX family)